MVGMCTAAGRRQRQPIASWQELSAACKVLQTRRTVVHMADPPGVPACMGGRCELVVSAACRALHAADLADLKVGRQAPADLSWRPGGRPADR